MAFPIATLSFDLVFGNVEDPFTKISKMGIDVYQPVLTEVLKETTDGDLNRFVRHVTANPGLMPFPSAFVSSPTKDRANSMVELRNRKPFLSVNIELTPRGYASELIRIQVLQHLLVTLQRFVSVAPNSGEFAWVTLHKQAAFGILEVSHGTVYILAYRKRPVSLQNVEMAILEPDGNQSYYVGLKSN